MADFFENTMAPWYPYRNDIIRLELPEGLARIGSMAFYGCKNLTAAVIPNSVESIGDFAFTNCTGMEILSLGNGVRTIGEAAFSDCISLKSLELPSGLTAIGLKGFYRCESIPSVVVPGTVTSLGISAFAYCSNLISADVRAPLAKLPEYLFYGCERLSAVSLPDSLSGISTYSFRGCESLNTVYYGGTSQTLDQVQQSIGNEVPGFENTGYISNADPGGPVISGTMKEDSNGTLIQENVTVIPGSNSTVTTKVESPVDTSQPEKTEAEITITVNGNQGWEEAKGILEKELEKLPDNTDNVTVDVYVKETDEIDSGFVESLAGKPVDVTITTQNGSVWKMDATQMDAEKNSGDYNLNYTLTAGTDELTAELGGNASFVLKFAESAKVNAEVLIRLGNTWSNQGATLFQREKDGISRIQAALVDYDGYAHFYLASVDKDIEYYIGMNIPADVQENAPIVPEEMLTNYGNVENIQPIQYEITGRKSSWNMGLGKVMAILAAVMVSAVAVVGAVMFFWNKQRLKNGYVPNWDDDET